MSGIEGRSVFPPFQSFSFKLAFLDPPWRAAKCCPFGVQKMSLRGIAFGTASALLPFVLDSCV